MITESGQWYMTLRNCWPPRLEPARRRARAGSDETGGGTMLAMFVAELGAQLGALVTNFGALLGGIL